MTVAGLESVLTNRKKMGHGTIAKKTEKKMEKAYTVCITFDFDAMSAWLGSHYKMTPARMSRGEYGARVGVPRILRLLREYQIPATFFVPGHSAESFPEAVEAILEAGHEIGHHGYGHEDPSEQTPDEERRSLDLGFEALQKLDVPTPRGYRSPSWDYSHTTLSLLVEYGFLYDSSLFAGDYHPYHPRIGDQVKIDSPLQKGTETSLWEIPVDFALDDWPHFTFDFSSPRSGLSSPNKVFDVWAGELDFMVQKEPDGIFTLTMHPQVIGRGHRMLLLERFIQHVLENGKAEFMQIGEYVKNLH